MGLAQWPCRSGWPLRDASPSRGLGLTHLGGEQLARLWVADGEGNIGVRSLLVLVASRELLQDPDQGEDSFRAVKHICEGNPRLLMGTRSWMWDPRREGSRVRAWKAAVLLERKLRR